MNFIRKYAALLIPVGIALAAVVFIVLTLTMGKSLGSDMDESISLGKNVESMARKAPSKTQYEQESIYQSGHEKDAENIEQLAKQGTLRQLLNYDIFPEPKETSQQIFYTFGDNYRAAIEQMVRNMNALDAPSDADINRREGGGNRGGRTARGVKSSRVKALCRERAKSISVYANPNLFSWYGFWEDFKYQGSDEAIEDCWYSQVSYWIYKDVAETITAMNTDSESVYDSSVKRLLGVSFGKPVEISDTTQTSSRSAKTGSDKPGYVTDEAKSLLAANGTVTGRIGDDEIDVVHFSVGIVIDSQAVMPFMKELCSEKEHKHKEGYAENGLERDYKHNQITILSSQIEPVLRQEKEHDYYEYGNNAVVRLDLICEYIFHRDSYDQIKPEPVKKAIGQSEESDSDSGGRGGGSSKNKKKGRKVSK